MLLCDVRVWARRNTPYLIVLLKPPLKAKTTPNQKKKWKMTRPLAVIAANVVVVTLPTLA